MRKKSINLIKGNEILAKDIYSNMDTVLMVSGMVLKNEYVEKLKKLDIKYVYIEDEFNEQSTERETIERRIMKHCQKAIESIYERYSYCGNVQLEELSSVAYQVIFEVLKEPNVLYNVDCVRQKHETIYLHSLNVCALAVLVGQKLGLGRSSLEDIAIGSLLHDIGYMYIDTNILYNNEGRFTPEQEKIIRKHVVYGYSEVENETWISKKAKNIIFSHHEYVNGSGYPLKLVRDEIDIETKVVTVCDEFDSIVFGELAPKMQVHEAIEYIISQMGAKFDKEVVDAFKQSVAAYPNGSIVLTNEGELGIVVRQNCSFPTRPVIKMLKDKNSVPYETDIERDLTKELTLFISETLE